MKNNKRKNLVKISFRGGKVISVKEILKIDSNQEFIKKLGKLNISK